MSGLVKPKEFNPPWWLANRHLQSSLGSVPPRKTWLGWSERAFMAESTPLILDCGAGVRLLAHESQAVGPDNGELVVFIHGWEGSADSSYLLSTAPHLARLGYRVIRLNLRDHGNSHHLNRELFHSCRLDEVVGAVQALQRLNPGVALSLVGFSLGGNFCLRVGSRAADAGLDIKRIVAICPVLDPAQTMRALDTGWSGYRHYFLRKWRRSLLRKSRHFPDLYDFANLQRFQTLESMTDFFVTGYTEYPDLRTYLRGYALTGSRLESLSVSSSVLLADDDPIIPVASLDELARTEYLQIHRYTKGGHCGFLASLDRESWLDRFIADELQSSSL
jgi:predicted alpha/beta-fold hydrolase